jgi:serine/threonine protein phosphatase 1
MQKENIKKGRTMVIGDIHGGYKALLQCLERSSFDKENDVLIQLGDVADGWSEVPECVDELLSIKNLISIKGNHDDWTTQWLFSGVGSRTWTSQGGQATIDAYNRRLNDEKDIIERHLSYFYSKQLNYYIDDKNRGFVHAGFNSRKGLGNEAYESDYYWDRDLWSLALLQDKNEKPEKHNEASAARRFDKHSELYIGHTSTVNWFAKGHVPEASNPNQVPNGRITVPMNRCNVWNLDTGCGFGGKLTIMDIETKEFYQSDFLTDLYPNEKGR